jgi:hypothetical protein
MERDMTTKKINHADLLARFTAADAQAIRDLAKQKKISIAKAIEHEQSRPARIRAEDYAEGEQVEGFSRASHSSSS